MAARRRFRDVLRALVPPWLADRPGFRVGFSVLWAMVAPLDILADVAMQGILSWFPGLGTTTALPYIGRSRGIPKGRNETSSDYAVRLRRWLDDTADMGSDEQLARQLAGYLGGSPRIRIFRRKNGACMTLETDGTITRVASTAWDWDSVSNPERNTIAKPFWSDQWIVIYSSLLPRPGLLGSLTNDGKTLGNDATLAEADAFRGIAAEWKSAGSRIRAVIWTTDGTLFDPATPASMPDGTWGLWGKTTATGSLVKSNRAYATCRFWEPR